MTAAIEVQDLRKLYKGKAAVDGLSLTVRQGEVYGFLGPNGAGKTTTVKVLTGLVRPSGGSARLLGHPVGDEKVRRRIGFLPELFRFHEWMTGRELVRFHGRLHGLDGSDLERRVSDVLELVGLAERGNDRVGGYSKGMQQRAGLATALVNTPDVVFLDEPTSALDPLGRLDVREIIHRLKSQGTTVFLNSHLLGEVELTCDRVAIVTKGRVVREGRLEELLTGKLEADLTLDRITPNLLALLAPHARVLTSDDRRLTVELRDEEDLPAVAAAVLSSGARLYALTPRRENLEELFVRLVKGEAA